MQPPQPPYGGPPFPARPGPPPPGPYGPGGGGPFPPGGPPRRSRAPLMIVIGLLAVLIVGGGVGAFVLLRPTGGERGRFDRDPAACSLLTLPQVQTYLPGAAPDGGRDSYFCEWSGRTGQLVIGVEVINGEHMNGTPERAHDQYEIRRRQANEPGVTITPQPIGDEAFIACKPPDELGHHSCDIYVRVSNVTFNLKIETFPGAREAAPAAQALAATAVLHLRQGT